MNEKQIALLQQQLDRLSVRHLDLELWKTYTVSVLAGIFGDNSLKIKQINAISYDFSSWALRDTSGNADFMETAKKTARAILEASIAELETDANKIPDTPCNSAEMVATALENYLTIGQFKELKKLYENQNLEESKRKAKEILKSLNEEALLQIISEIIVKTKFE